MALAALMNALLPLPSVTTPTMSAAGFTAVQRDQLRALHAELAEEQRLAKVRGKGG